MKIVTMRDERDKEPDALLFHVSEDTWRVVCELLTLGCQMTDKDRRVAEGKIKHERAVSERVKGQTKWAVR